MAEPQVAPYGSWRSPVTSDLIVRGSIGLSMTALDGASIYWIEGRPTEAGRSVIVRRDAHTASPEHEAVNTIVSLALDGTEGGGRVLASGYDFYSSPRLSPDGRRLAWLCWNHPNMPWDGCELWVAEVEADGTLGQMDLVAGGRDEAIFQPEWSPAGVLHFVSDRSGWWNLYRAGREADAVQETGLEIEPLCEMAAEFGQPQWIFGYSTYAFIAPTQIICTYIERGLSRLALLDTTART